MENCPAGQRGPKELADPFKACQSLQSKTSMAEGQHRWMQNSCLSWNIKRKYTADGSEDGLPVMNIEAHDDYP